MQFAAPRRLGGGVWLRHKLAPRSATMPGVIPDEQLARDQLRYLEIVPEGIARMEGLLGEAPLSLPRWDDAPILPGVTPEVAEYMLLINSCNFSYWPDPGQPEWGVELEGRWWPDALGLY